MILAAVDDLMLASKIRQAAAGAGVELVFPRTTADILDRARAERPRMVILDLNSRRLDARAAVAELKRDPALASIPTLAFVSHVQADLVAAARAAGVDRVLARSAFFEQLPALLAGTSP